MNARLDAAFPSGPLIDAASGEVTPAWRAFLFSLWLRTGAAHGMSSDTSALQAELDAEEAARAAADAALTSGLSHEAELRQAGDTALRSSLNGEVRTREVADFLHTKGIHDNSAAITAEANARIAADALLVPIAQLCSMWAACDLSFLPTADPGSGKPWLDGTHLVVGTPAGTVVGIGLEDASGRWVLQDGSGAWVWG